MSDIMSACNSHQSTLWTQSISMRFCWVVIFFGLTLSAKNHAHRWGGWGMSINLSIKKFCHPQLLYDWCCGNKKQKQKHFPGVSWQSFHYTIMTIKSCQEMLHRTKSIIFSKEWEVTVVNLSEQILIEKKITSLSYKTWKIMILIIIIFFQCHLLVNLAWYIFPQIRFETKRWKD